MSAERATITVMAESSRVICASDALEEKGRGVRFSVDYHGHSAAAFAVRFEGQVHGYLNRCSHVPMELDWTEGEFFDSTKRDLLCSTHGAAYETTTGRCIWGPCRNTPLVKLNLAEREGSVYYEGFSDE